MLKLFKLAGPQSFIPPPIAPWDHFASDDYLLIVKGAPDVLFSRCAYVLDPAGGPPIAITREVRARMTTVQEQWAQDGQRVLLLARRIVKNDEIHKLDPQSEEFAELIEQYRNDLIVLGLVGLIDPLKPSIPDVVATCRGAGIRFFIVTGASSRQGGFSSLAQ